MLKSFEELDAEAGPAWLMPSPPSNPLREDTAGFTTVRAEARANEVSQRSTIAAAFRQDNTVASILSREDLGVDNTDDKEFDAIAYIKDNPSLAGYERSFIGVLNGRRADAVKAQIEKEQRDKETLAASGWAGTFAQIAAGVFDAPTLIPGAVVVRGAKGGYAIGRSMLTAGASAGATQAATEGVLQSSQELRTAGESLVNIGGAAVLGSLLGGGVAALLSKNETIAATRALDNIIDINSGAKPNEFVPASIQEGRAAPGSAGAAVAEGEFFVDPVNKPRLRSELEVDGKAASAVASATSWFTPVLRSTQRYAASARQIADNLYENSIYKVMHRSGETTGAAVETAARVRVEASQFEALGKAENAYATMRKEGVRMSRDDFYEEVGKAMRNSDESGNAYVSQAAKGYRKLFDDFTKEAVALKIMDPEDLDVKTAASYFSRIYARDRLLASETQFVDLIGRHYAGQMQDAHKLETANHKTKVAAYEQRIANLALTGEARAARLSEVRAAGGKLDAQYAEFADLTDNLTEARAALRGAEGEARTAAKKQIEDIHTQGGAEFKDYLKQQQILRRAEKDLTELNPDAQLAKGEKVQERVARVEEQASRSMLAFGSRAKNLLNKLADDPVGVAEETLGEILQEVSRLQKSLGKSEKRIQQLEEGAAKGDQPEALAQYWAARKAEVQADKEVASRLVEELGGLGLNMDLDALRSALKQKPQRDVAAGAARRKAQLEGRIDTAQASAVKGRAELSQAEELVATLNELLDSAAGKAAKVNLNRGEQLKRLKERAAALSPEEVAARAAKNKKILEDMVERQDDMHYRKWGEKLARDRETNTTYDFEAVGKSTALDIYRKLTGKEQQLDDVPSFVTKITAGPMKDRTFMVPDELLAGQDWLLNDVRVVANRYSRAMAGEIELTRRFGRADMRDQLTQVSKEYTELRTAVQSSASIEELNNVLGRDKFSSRKNLDSAKLEANRVLTEDEMSTVRDLKEGRDSIRGSGKGHNNTNFASMTRSLMAFNYITRMGGVLIPNLADLFRPAMVHGLMPFMDTVPKALAQAFDAGSEGVRASIKEAQLSALITNRVTHSAAAALGDVGDPFVSNVSKLERFMDKAVSVGSKWNLINVATDAAQTVSSVISQHRIIDAALGNGGKDGSFSKDGIALLRYLGIGQKQQDDIARLFTLHGETLDGVKVANTERWLEAAAQSGNTAELKSAEEAVRAYRNALNKDVNSIVSRKGLGDTPLFANHPIGKVITQWSGYTMGAHSRVTIRGLQEGHSSLVGGVIALSSLGMLTSYLSAWRGGAERWEKYKQDVANNPSILVGEGLDRSGFFSLFFDVSNRVERASSSVGYQYRFNPIKSSINKAAGGSFFADTPSTRSSETAGVLSAVGGPSFGLIESTLAAGRVAAAKYEGRDPSKRDVSQALAIIPFQSYYGAREIMQVLNGNSTYTRP